MKFFGEQPLVMCSMFSAAAFLDRAGHGHGGHWVDALYRFVERKQKQGVDGGRCWIEADFWDDRDDNPNNDHPFFNQQRASSGQLWDYRQLVRGVRPEKLTYYQQYIILQLVKLARTTGFKLNLVTDATLKHSNIEGRVLDWKTIGQCIRQVSHYYDCIHHNRQDVEAVHEKLRDLFTEVAGPIDDHILEEHHNEYGAHSWSSWKAAYEDECDGDEECIKRKALWEVNQQLKRSDDPERQWNEGLVCVSDGGNNHPEFNVGPDGADVLAVHHERNGAWDDMARLAHLEDYGVHVYINETEHFVDPLLWPEVVGPDGWFSTTSSTKDAERLLRFRQKNLALGRSWCDHSLVNMACGQWVHGHVWGKEQLTEMELDAFEKLLDSSSPPPPPQPPTPPQPPPEKEYELYPTGKDKRGHFNVKIEFPKQPSDISQGQSFTQKVKVKLPEECVIYRVDSFNGLDRGDIVEMDTFVYDESGRVLYQRSLHKETLAMYDSFCPRECDALTRSVDIHMHAHVTKSDEPARAHWNIMLWCMEP